jgi:enamine deaminase RidA (YjgF/YER057c/UK114 family)
MAEPRFLVPAGYGEYMRENYHYSQGVRVGDVIYVTGQGGWDEGFNFADSVHDQIRQAFKNVETVLAEADASWENVVDITSYHVGLDDSVLGTMVEQLKRYCPTHEPLWTVLGVVRLALPAMKVEITANAVAPS